MLKLKNYPIFNHLIHQKLNVQNLKYLRFQKDKTCQSLLEIMCQSFHKLKLMSFLEIRLFKLLLIKLMESKPFILVKQKMIKDLERVFSSLKNQCLREYGWMIKEKKEYNRQRLENIKDNLKMDSDQEMGNFSGATENIIQVNGRMARRMVVDIGDLRKGRVIWVNGEMAKSLEMVYTQ